MAPSTLYYVADPMCSWCWGFSQVLEKVEENLPDQVDLRYVMGGLAPDSDEPMPPEMQERIQRAWQAVAARTGAEFNRDFWIQCQPRRSTYPACRAVLAAELQDAGRRMFCAVQRAYYLEARNPSDVETLVELAGELSLDQDAFARDIASPQIEARLQEDLAQCRALRVSGFPSLVLESDGTHVWIAHGCEDLETVLGRLRAAGCLGSGIEE